MGICFVTILSVRLVYRICLRTNHICTLYIDINFNDTARIYCFQRSNDILVQTI